MADMTQPQDATQKITGNISEELTEAAYRLSAQQLVRGIRAKLLDKIPDQNNDAKQFLKTPVGEAVLSFALAAALEMFPAENLKDVRSCLASNLRIQSYEFLGDFLLGFTTEIDAQVALVATTLESKVKAAANGENYTAPAETKS
jgi:hypothetical protein